MEHEVRARVGVTVRETRTGPYYYVPRDFPPIVVCTPVSGYIQDDLWYPYD